MPNNKNCYSGYLLLDFQTIFTKWASTMNITAQMMTAARQLFGMKKKEGVKTEIANRTREAAKWK